MNNNNKTKKNNKLPRNNNGTTRNNNGTPRNNNGTTRNNNGTPRNNNGTPRNNNGTPRNNKGTSRNNNGTSRNNNAEMNNTEMNNNLTEMNNNTNNNTIGMSNNNLRNQNNNSKDVFAKEFITIMLESVHIIKLYHWKTKSYATHKATDGLHSKLGDLIDHYVEVLIGKTNLNLKMTDYSNLQIKNIENNEEMEKFVQGLINFLLKVHNKLDAEKDVDLLNLRDELIAELNQFLYLLRLQ
jgi:hypothetical protein